MREDYEEREGGKLKEMHVLKRKGNSNFQFPFPCFPLFGLPCAITACFPPSLKICTKYVHCNRGQ